MDATGDLAGGPQLLGFVWIVKDLSKEEDSLRKTKKPYSNLVNLISILYFIKYVYI